MTKRCLDRIGPDITVWSLEPQFKLGERVRLTSAAEGIYVRNYTAATLTNSANFVIDGSASAVADASGPYAMSIVGTPVPSSAYFWAYQKQKGIGASKNLPYSASALTRTRVLNASLSFGFTAGAAKPEDLRTLGLVVATMIKDQIKN